MDKRILIGYTAQHDSLFGNSYHSLHAAVPHGRGRKLCASSWTAYGHVRTARLPGIWPIGAEVATAQNPGGEFCAAGGWWVPCLRLLGVGMLSALPRESMAPIN